MRLPCFWLLIFLPVGLTGCLSGPFAQNGALIGGAIGAPVGAVIGARNGNAGAGALIGGTIGALSGNNLGGSIDANNQAGVQYGGGARPLSSADIIYMSQSGLGEEVIINQIRQNGVAALPSPNELVSLKNAGVSDRVIQAMQGAVYPGPQRQPSSPVIVEEHYWGAPYHVRPYRFHDPYCAPAPYRPRRRGSSISFSHRF